MHHVKFIIKHDCEQKTVVSILAALYSLTSQWLLKPILQAACFSKLFPRNPAPKYRRTSLPSRCCDERRPIDEKQDKNSRFLDRPGLMNRPQGLEVSCNLRYSRCSGWSGLFLELRLDRYRVLGVLSR